MAIVLVHVVVVTLEPIRLCFSQKQQHTLLCCSGVLLELDHHSSAYLAARLSRKAQKDSDHTSWKTIIYICRDSMDIKMLQYPKKKVQNFENSNLTSLYNNIPVIFDCFHDQQSPCSTRNRCGGTKPELVTTPWKAMAPFGIHIRT